ncbi:MULTISPECIES: MinD/ParA family protein [Kyrpidia]|uniref:Site-determining protein n=2 Tax=Kyrpidia spormannii TaxID=2055160 RepID=A0ACA8Z9K8_9BACL|nr:MULTISPECIES: MinD/ParA family protein [Kyrpidia]MCL6574744.1 MinD/ParA family protein [Kyrpidia sp.]CAB3392480.1 Site-determining protein [Kyrpidia spormannii]CAB3393404.1 Site-determining protein [Kyrpidia spormannii]
MDQASELRKRMAHQSGPRGVSLKTAAVTSGKGGVGKSNVAVNVALALQQERKNTLILDTDVGFANVNVLLGSGAGRTLLDLAQPGVLASDVVQTGPLGISWISGGTALPDWIQLSRDQVKVCFDKLMDLESTLDWVIVDTGAGLNESSLHLLESVDQILLVTTPEPTALADAYALIKVLVRRSLSARIRIVVNRCRTFSEGIQTFQRLVQVSKTFLSFEPGAMGYILEDPAVGRAVFRQTPFLLSAPDSRAAQCVRQIARRLMGGEDVAPAESPPSRRGWREFIWKLQHALGRG